VQEIKFFHTDYKDIYRYQGNNFPAFLLSHKDKTGIILLKETSCIIKYDLENQNHQHEIPYSDIRAILSEPVTFKNKFSSIQFTIALYSTQQYEDAIEKLYTETRDEDASPDGIEYAEDYIIYSSVCESKNMQPCSLKKAMSVLETASALR
jgi:hypothetical protein